MIRMCTKAEPELWLEVSNIALRKKSTREKVMIALMKLGIEFGKEKATAFSLLKELIPDPSEVVIVKDVEMN